jgi:hypothetical protein
MRRDLRSPDLGSREDISSALQAIKTVGVGRRENDLFLQVVEVERWRIGHVRPIKQISALLQGEVYRGHKP